MLGWILKHVTADGKANCKVVHGLSTVATWDGGQCSIPMLFKGQLSLCVYLFFFIHSTADGDLVCLHILDIVNNAAVNMKYRNLYDILFSFHSEVAMLDHMVVLFLIYRRTSTLFYTVTVEIYIHSNSVMVENLMHCWPFACLWQMSVQFLCPLLTRLLFFLLHCMSSLCIFWILTPSKKYGLQIFSYLFVGFLSYLFCCAEKLLLCVVPLVYFLYCLCFCVMIENAFPNRLKECFL